MAGNAGVVDPVIGAVMSAQPVASAERLTRGEMRGVGLLAAAGILAMHARGPAVADFLRHRPTRKGEPGLVEPDAAPVRAGHPDHHRRCVHQRAETRVETARWLGGNGRVLIVHSVLLAFALARKQLDRRPPQRSGAAFSEEGPTPKPWAAMMPPGSMRWILSVGRRNDKPGVGSRPKRRRAFSPTPPTA